MECYRVAVACGPFGFSTNPQNHQLQPLWLALQAGLVIIVFLHYLKRRK
ncbi:MAG: hypothetical protein JW749_09530 [Sedimentisphaerales bacterium]|nr:hypothetical protein [Sedimentisphaerales bacterium]